MASKNSNTKHPDYLYAAFISDIHLGAQNTQTAHIIRNLDAMFPNNEVTAQLDVIYIAGDVFDRDLMLTDPQVMDIQLWIFRFLRMCKQHDIQLRVLKGTPSHDWNQCLYFEHCNDQGDIGCDLVYHAKLDIEYQSRLGLNVLYIPDEWKPTTDETWEDVQEKMREKQVDSVDLVIMHGMFGFQLPEIAHLDKHQEERYLNITNLTIVCGHVHQANHYDRIYIPGSPDRLCHGDEGEKSHVRMKFYKDPKAVSGFTPKDRDVVRIPNKQAKIYRTIGCDGLTLEEALDRLRHTAESVPSDSHLRIKASADHPVIRAITVLRSSHPLINWSTKRVTDTGRPAEKLISVRRTYDAVQITQDNIAPIVDKKMRTMSDNDGLIQRALELLTPLT
jgi:hypothetical protein